MSHANPLLPPGSSLDDRKSRKTRILVTVFGIVALHVIPISGLLLMQGCKPDIGAVVTKIETGENEEVPSLTSDDLYRQFEDNDPNLSLPLETEVPPQYSDNPTEGPTRSTEIILDEPGQNEVAETPMASPVETAQNVPAPATREPISTPINVTSEAPELNLSAKPVTVPPAPAPKAIDYKIKSGDRLYSLAKEYGLSVAELQEANPGLDPRKLRVGQNIVIPKVAPKPAASAPANVAAAAPAGKTYQVKKGDTLTRIARANGVTLRALREANSLRSDRILIGQKLSIPVAEMASAAGQ